MGGGAGGLTESEKSATHSPMHKGRGVPPLSIIEEGADDFFEADSSSISGSTPRTPRDIDHIVGEDSFAYKEMESADEDETEEEMDDTHDIESSGVAKEDTPLPSACLKMVDEMLLVIHKKPQGYWRRNKNLMYHVVPLMFTKLPLIYLLITVALWNGVGEYSDYSYEYETSMPRSALLYKQVRRGPGSD